MDLADPIQDRPHELHVVDVLLLRPHPCDATTIIPVSIHCLGIDNQEALFRSQIVEPGVPLHLAGVAPTSVKSQDHGQWLVEPLRGKDEVIPADPINGDRVLNGPAVRLGRCCDAGEYHDRKGCQTEERGTAHH